MADPGGGITTPPMDGPDRQVLNRGVRWTALAQGMGAFLQLGVIVVLARLLEPSDFGLLAMASAIIAIVSAVQTLGTHGPLIQRERVAPILIDTVFLLNLALALLLMTVVILTAPWIAGLYQSSEVEPLVRVIAIALVLYALSGVPGALLARRMHFGALAINDSLGAVTFAVVALALAWSGHGVWSLVVAMLASSAVEALFLIVIARYRPRLRFSWPELRSIAGYSANMTGVNVVGVILRNADSLIIGRWLGPRALGLYGMGTRFTREPVDLFVNSVLEPILFPAYSRMQHDDARTARTMQRALAGAAFVMFPVLGGVAAIARPFVDGVLGADWTPVILLLVLMAPIGMLRTLLATVTTIFLARDRTRLLFGIHLGGGVLMLCAYLLGAQIGLVAVVAALLVAELVMTVIELTLCARLIRTRLHRLVAGAAGPLFATGVMVAIVAALDVVLAGLGWSDLAILALVVPVGMLSYTVLAVGLRLQALDDLLELLPPQLRIPLLAVRNRLYGQAV